MYFCRMMRKEIHLTEDVVKLLEKKAKARNRNLKNYLEHLVIEDSKESDEPPEEYKIMMDARLEKIEKGEMKFISHEEMKAKHGF